MATVELNDRNPITQDDEYTFATVPGDWYSVTFGGSTFGGGTFVVQLDDSLDHDGTSWQPYASASFTAAGAVIIKAVANTTRIEVTSSTAPSVPVNVVRENK